MTLFTRDIQDSWSLGVLFILTVREKILLARLQRRYIFPSLVGRLLKTEYLKVYHPHIPTAQQQQPTRYFSGRP
jgi:hypothetical protein